MLDHVFFFFKLWLINFANINRWCIIKETGKVKNIFFALERTSELQLAAASRVKETTDEKENVRLFEVDDKADEVSVVRRSVPLPGQFNPRATGTVWRKCEDGAFACGNQSWNHKHSQRFKQRSPERKSDVTRTAGPVAVVLEVALVKAAPDARFLPHLVNLRHAQLRVGLEKQLSRLDCEVVLRPVPKILELMVVKRREGIHAGGEKKRKNKTPENKESEQWFSGLCKSVGVGGQCVPRVIKTIGDNCIMAKCTMRSLECKAQTHFSIWWDRFRRHSVMSHCVRIQTLWNGGNVDLGTEIPCNSRRKQQKWEPDRSLLGTVVVYYSRSKRGTSALIFARNVTPTPSPCFFLVFFKMTLLLPTQNIHLAWRTLRLPRQNKHRRLH